MLNWADQADISLRHALMLADSHRNGGALFERSNGIEKKDGRPFAHDLEKRR
jgi:hypothetical protein